MEKRNLVALGAVAFMGVFREAFETVLFLRALLLEAGGNHESVLALGVLSSFVLVIVLSWFAVRWSAKLPVRQLFLISSWVMFFLAFTLMGKGIHALQEVGYIGMTPTPWSFRMDLLGVFPTYETLLSQLILSVLMVVVLKFGDKAVRRAGQATA